MWYTNLFTIVIKQVLNINISYTIYFIDIHYFHLVFVYHYIVYSLFIDGSGKEQAAFKVPWTILQYEYRKGIYALLFYEKQ